MGTDTRNGTPHLTLTHSFAIFPLQQASGLLQAKNVLLFNQFIDPCCLLHFRHDPVGKASKQQQLETLGLIDRLNCSIR
jgi:hypothetical protein